jgi:hypothetical protein
MSPLPLPPHDNSPVTCGSKDALRKSQQYITSGPSKPIFVDDIVFDVVFAVILIICIEYAGYSCYIQYKKSKARNKTNRTAEEAEELAGCEMYRQQARRSEGD